MSAKMRNLLHLLAVLSCADGDLDCTAALCAQADPDVWYPEKGRPDQERVAKAICSTCPIQANCLADAVRRNEPLGIWGGASEADRRVLRSHLDSLASKAA